MREGFVVSKSAFFGQLARGLLRKWLRDCSASWPHNPLLGAVSSCIALHFKTQFEIGVYQLGRPFLESVRSTPNCMLFRVVLHVTRVARSTCVVLLGIVYMRQKLTFGAVSCQCRTSSNECHSWCDHIGIIVASFWILVCHVRVMLGQG